MPQMQDEAGNIWEVDAQGNPIALVSQAATEAPPQDPAFQYEGRKASAQTTREEIGVRGDATDIANTESTIIDRAEDNRRADSRVSSQNATDTVNRRTAGLPAGYKWSANGEEVVKIPGYEFKDDESGKMNDKAVSAKRLLEMLDGEDGIAAQFDENFTNQGIASVNEFNPFREANERFDKKTNAMLPFAKKLLRTPGEGSQSDKEAQDYRDQLPRSTFRDGTNAQLIEDLRATALSVLENEGIDPTTYDQKTGKFLEVVNEDRTALAGAGATSESVPIPNAMQQEHADWIANNNGMITADNYVAFRRELDKKHGFTGEFNEASHRDYGTWLQEKGNVGGKVNANIPAPERDLNVAEQALNNFGNSTAGAVAINAANMGGFGIPEALTGDAISDVNAENPNAALAGQVIGGITGAGMIGRGAGAVAGKVAPSLLGGGTKAQVARNVATDAAYGGAYGGIAGDSALEGAAFGTLGSLGGQALGGTLSAGLRGARVSPAVQALKDKGVSMSVGRQLGKGASRAEDLMQSWPIVGGQVRARQADSFTDFNKGAMEIGGQSIGLKPTATGTRGIDQFRDGVSDAYTDATTGKTIDIDGQFQDDLAGVAALRGQLPDDVGGRFDKLMENHTAGLQPSGQMTGDQFQRAMRGLTSARGKASTVAQEFDQPYREAATGAMDAFTGVMGRGGGDDVVRGLKDANLANTNLNILEDAVGRSRNGTRTGEIDVFAPSQLGDAAHKARKYGGQDLADYAKLGQEVLPSSVPNSGTADRAMAVAGLGALGLGGSGFGMSEGNVDYDPTNLTTGAGFAGALALLGTRRGQKAVEAALINRPQAMQRLGDGLGRRTGLFGHGGAGVALNGQ